MVPTVHQFYNWIIRLLNYEIDIADFTLEIDEECEEFKECEAEDECDILPPVPSFPALRPIRAISASTDILICFCAC